MWFAVSQMGEMTPNLLYIRGIRIFIPDYFWIVGCHVISF